MSSRSHATALLRDAVMAGHQGDEAAARRFIDHADPDVRIAALAALVRMDRATTADLEAGLADPNPRVRRRAVELSAERTEPGLIPLLGDDDDLVVEMTAWALGERPPTPEAVAALASVVADHGDALCREAAVAALGALGDPGGLPAILAACNDKATVRRRAVLALAPFDGPDVRATLERATGDRDWQVRQAAEDLLAIEGTPSRADEGSISDGNPGTSP
ncbi:MAG: hypothetical protein HKN26_07855 [Acidimicrobiales bacterium]|nr:hypothetical protein [Acidimicrobiales bacterium]